MSLSSIEMALINQGMSRKEIVDKIEAIANLPQREKKSTEEAAKMLLDLHPGFELLIRSKNEEDFF